MAPLISRPDLKADDGTADLEAHDGAADLEADFDGPGSGVDAEKGSISFKLFLHEPSMS